MGAYSYGFNGKENDNEVKGTGNQQDYGLRIYDPRIARFLSVDPLTKKYAELTPYQFASNSPIENIDLDGAEKLSYMDRLPTNTVAEGIGNSLYNVLGTAYNGIAGAWNTVVDVGSNSKNGLGIGLMTTAQSGYESNIKPTVNYITKTPASQQLSDLKKDFQDPNTYFQAFEQGAAAWAFWKIGNGSLLNKTTAAQTQLLTDVGVIRGNWVTENISGWSQKATSYQEYVTGARAGKAFEVNGVRFDGVRNNTLLEAKSSYDNFINKKTGDFQSWFMQSKTGARSLINQAQRQLDAANGASIEWNFSSQKTLDATRRLFKENKIEGIDLKYNPQK